MIAPHVLREYAFVADGHRGALIGPRGDVAWLCAPRWDSPAVFAALAGGNGAYVVRPRDESFVWGGWYEPGALVFRSHWTTTSTTLDCHEALAAPADADRVVLLRRIEAVHGIGRVEVALDLRADFGREPSSVAREEDGTWVITSGEVVARWSGAADAAPDADGVLRLHLDLDPGHTHDLVLEIGTGRLGERVDAEHAWRATRAWWEHQVPQFAGSASPRDSRHSYAVLRGMSTPGGGMVAAATLGLPERAEAGRNYDYRYVWLRDQAYAGIAVAVEEPLPLLGEYLAVTTDRVLAHDGEVAPAYTVDGRLPPTEQTLDLPGYPGGADVVGNWVRQQFQLDSLGELLQLYATAGRHDLLQSDDARAVTTVVDVIERRWREPDAGVWELDDAWWSHSRLACVAGLRAMAPYLAGSEVARATSLADTLLAETAERCLSPEGVWQQQAGRRGLDAALLLPPVRGALPADDPRSLATLAAIEEDLAVDGYLYRNRPDDRPLGEAEGAFLMCGFAMSLAQLAAGNVTDAFRWFERQRAACGPAGLLSEEFDVRQRQLRGNLPQGFVHAMLLETSQRLGAVG